MPLDHLRAQVTGRPHSSSTFFILFWKRLGLSLENHSNAIFLLLSPSHVSSTEAIFPVSSHPSLPQGGDKPCSIAATVAPVSFPRDQMHHKRWDSYILDLEALKGMSWISREEDSEHSLNRIPVLREAKLGIKTLGFFPNIFFFQIIRIRRKITEKRGTQPTVMLTYLYCHLNYELLIIRWTAEVWVDSQSPKSLAEENYVLFWQPCSLQFHTAETLQGRLFKEKP